MSTSIRRLDMHASAVRQRHESVIRCVTKEWQATPALAAQAGVSANSAMIALKDALAADRVQREVRITSNYKRPTYFWRLPAAEHER